jgi:hypothetical protein
MCTAGNLANSLQYTVASPMSHQQQQPMTPAILSAITSPALQGAQAPGGHASGPQGGPAPNTQPTNAAAAGGQLTAAYPYHHHLPPIDMAASMAAAAGLGVDWGSLAYTLPAGMYAL